MRYETVGMGDASSLNLGTQIGSTVGSSTVSILVAAGVISGPVGAVIGGAIAGVTLLIHTLFKPNVDKIYASNDANQIEQILKQNLANYLSVPVNQRTVAVQAAALSVFDQAWNKYLQLVQTYLKKAPNSISDRQQGGCVYHTAQPAGWEGTTYIPNEPNQSTGSCWNWFIGYRDPIANDPNVIPDTMTVQSVSNGVSEIFSVGTVNNSSLLLLAAVLIGGGILVSQT